EGFEVVILPVDDQARVRMDVLAEALRPDVALVAVMAANNETGVVQPLEDVVDLVRSTRPEAAVHTDAVQAFAWLDVASVTERFDLVAISAHKFGGPKGAGALVVREGVELSPILHGGGQERERRSGTHDVAGIVGMAAAAEATVRDRVGLAATARRLRDRLLDAVVATVPGVRPTLPVGTPSLPNIAHLLVDGVESEALLFLLDEAGVCASAGSACASGAVEPSHVLLAMGVDRASAGGALRFSLGTSTTEEDVDAAAKALSDAVTRLRGCP
ncbi:MAG TPA: cysteine desulfurase family protein, partial [Acidimicrobiales bacterium]|nr:cysteine desulfurase family protein [Acidimicrobiales bacterium]